MSASSVSRIAKRGIDVVVAGCGLATLGPAMLAIAALIKLDSPGGALFVQERLGRGGRPFRLLKFRTMREAPIQYNEDGSTRVEVGDDRVTRVGRYLRGALDELPQMINVLRGQMSIVGPRPDLVHQRGLYTGNESNKLSVRPGITSLAIVLGRTELPWKTRIAIDVRYVEEWSLMLDIKIMLQTLLMPFGVAPFLFDEVVRVEELRASDG